MAEKRKKPATTAKTSKKSAKKGGRAAAFLRTVMTWLQVAAVTMLWCSAGSVYVSPEHFSWISLLGIGFPIFLAFAVLVTLLSLVLAFRRSWIGIVGILCCCGTIYTYCPVNIPSPAPKSALKVISYNSMNYGAGETDENKDSRAGNYIVRSGADIFCVQEAGGSLALRRKIRAQTRRMLPYHDTVIINSDVFACYSRLPIVKKEAICSSYGNGSAAFFLVPKRGDTILVVNNHLKSHSLSPKERADFRDIVLDCDTLGGERSVKRLFGIAKKMATSSVDRAKQAKTVSAYVKQHKHLPIILTGDFNDTPVSYARRVMSEGLTDCFRAAGNGIGRTFNHHAMYVRIDHIFCSSHFKPYATRVEQDGELSDHDPVVTYLQRR